MGKHSVKVSIAKAALLSATISLSGCSTISGWFTDEEELEVRVLEPIDAKFTPQEVWESNVGDGVGRYFSRLRPAVGYDLVVAASRQGIVSAFEKDSGKRVWRKDFADYSNDGAGSWFGTLWSDGISAKIAGGITLAYETVFFGTENGDVFALDVKTGEQKWHSKIKGEVLAAPAVDENVVVVNTGAGLMFALDASNGEELWRYESDVPALSLRGISAPTAGSGGAIVGTATGKLAVNIIDSGQTVWEQTIAAPSGATELDRIVDIDSKPLLVGGTVYVISFDGTLASVDLRSGRVLWKREYKSYRRISLSGNQLFVVDTNSNIYSLDRRNGVEQWSQGTLKGRVLTAAEPVGEYLAVGDKYGFLHWLNRSDGELVARLDVGGDDEDNSIFAAPVSDGKVLYTLTREGELFAIQIP